MSLREDWAAGQAILNWSWLGTAVFTVTASAATILPSWFQWPNLVVSLLLFAGGVATMLWALLLAIARSRLEVIGIGGLFFAAGSAPRQVQRILLTSLAVEVVVALVTASIRLYTPLAFGTLVPFWALGLSGLWCARFGDFKARHLDSESG